jgi:hypothetical protein
MDIPQALIDAKAVAEFGLLSLPGVVGVGLGAREENEQFFDELAVRVLVDDLNQVPAGLPEEILGVPICIIERRYDPIAFPDDARYPQLRGGIRIEKPSRGFGTVGAFVRDNASGQILGLSCFHVVGPPDDGFPDQVWQPNSPPLPMGGSPPARDDFVGKVLRTDFPDTPPLPFSPIRVSMTDSAVFSTDGAAVQGRGTSRAIAGLGLGQPDLVTSITATAEPAMFQPVRKRGFVTGTTSGLPQQFVAGLYTTVNWSQNGPNPFGGPNHFLVNQVEIFGGGGIFAEPGDSGSLVIDGSTPTALGLLWGASRGGPFAAPGKFGTMSLIGNVEAQLGVSMIW